MNLQKAIESIGDAFRDGLARVIFYDDESGRVCDRSNKVRLEFDSFDEFIKEVKTRLDKEKTNV